MLSNHITQQTPFAALQVFFEPAIKTAFGNGFTGAQLRRKIARLAIELDRYFVMWSYTSRPTSVFEMPRHL